MSAIDQGLVRQGRQPGQAGPHLLGGALEHPPAPQGEQGVADEGHAVGGVIIGDVPQGMAARLHHLEAGMAKLDHIALADRPVQGSDPRHLLRPDDGAAGGLLQPGVAAGVVGVPVGVHHQGQGPAEPLQLAQDGLGVGGVDGRHLSGVLVARQEAVVVVEAGKLMDLERHDGTRWCVSI